MKRLRYTLLPLVLIALSTQAQTRDYTMMHSGIRAFAAGNINKAQKRFNAAQRSNPNNARIMFALGDVALEHEDDSLALVRFVEASDHEQSPYVKAMSFHNTGLVHHSHAYQQSLALDSLPSSQSAELYQATVKSLETAIAAYKEALRNNPHDDDTRYNLALAQRQLKDLMKDPPPQQQDNKENPNESNSGNNKQDDPNSDEQDKNNNPEGNDSNQNNQNPPPPKQSDEENFEQLLNLARQAEEQTRARMQQMQNQQGQTQHLKKNW